MDEYLEAYSLRGYDRSFMGDYGGAIEDFTKAIELDPGEATNYRRRGGVLFAQRSYKDALTDFQAAAELDPSDAYALFGEAAAAMASGGVYSHDDVISLLDEAIRLEPGMAYAYDIRGMVRFEIGDFSGAEKDFESAIMLGLCGWDIFFKRGDARHGLSRKNAAKSDYLKSLRMSPPSAPDVLVAHIYMQLSCIAGDQRDRREAIQWLSKAIYHCPNDAGKYRLRGLYSASLAVETGDRKYNTDAVNDFTVAIALDPDHAATYGFRSEQWEELGQWGKAIADLHHCKTLKSIKNPHYLSECG